ncbi:hypothetical protein [Streptomyces chartreusis]|uniref:hypothetical protein n=1 Tax=Streptomyces chartreusis TaxID=1969 RepID=UPI003630C1A6
MELTLLDPVYAGPGPYACSYPDTPRDVPDPEAAISTRSPVSWRSWCTVSVPR